MGARAQHGLAYRRFCSLLRRWRVDAGLTQRDLALKLKKPASYVHKSEVADRRLDPLELVEWCKACGISRSSAIEQVEAIR